MSKTGLTFRWLVVPLSFIAFSPSSMATCEVGSWIPGCSAGVDTTRSLGQFAIRLTKEMGEKLVPPPPHDCPGDWNDPFDACVIWSPVLYDPNTQIGRSDPFIDRHPQQDAFENESVCDNGGPIFCNIFDPDPVTDEQMEFPTTKFVEGPTGTEEVHTKIISLNMTDDQTQCGTPSKNAVRAGNAMTVVPVAKRKRSIGEVESLNTPPGGFPAESFFNMFVEVDLDWGMPGVDMTVYNPIVPLTVQNSALTGFPPQVVYIHGGNEDDGAPPVREVNTDKLIGWIILAGHGVGGKDISCAELANFGDKIKGMARDILKVKPLAVSLDSFQVQVNNGKVILDWQTGVEANNAAFNIWEGKLLPGKTKCTLNMEDYSLPTVRVVSSVNSQGTEVSGAEYTYTQSVTSGTYCYAIEDVEYGEVTPYRDDKFHFPDSLDPVIVP